MGMGGKDLPKPGSSPGFDLAARGGHTHVFLHLGRASPDQFRPPADSYETQLATFIPTIALGTCAEITGDVPL
jgi:hypothetical protein